MKVALSLMTALLSAVFSSPAAASSSADISVIGSVAPAPCNVVIAGGNKFNFGTLRSDELHATEHNHFFQDKVITINCPAPTALLVAFPFNNGGQLQPHGSSSATGQLNWWSYHSNDLPERQCIQHLPPEERVKINVGDGNLIDSPHMVRIIPRGGVIHQTCPAENYFISDRGDKDGAQEGFYIGAPSVLFMQIPRTLRMTVNPRDNLDTSGAIQLRGGATVVINYL